jgi:glutathione-regulated potassium-efflux system ancillary protein KefC
MLIVVLLAGLLLFKLVTLWIVARIMGVTARQRWLFASLLAQGGEFAFVVFSTAEGRGLLTAEWANRLTIAVALSMAMTPLMLLLHDKLIAWRLTLRERGADVIDEAPPPVIIAGFGRFGQIVGRLLFANGIRAIVLDHDPEQIELLRKQGYKVFYGDATRLDLLRAAGASRRSCWSTRSTTSPTALPSPSACANPFPSCRSSPARATSTTTFSSRRAA